MREIGLSAHHHFLIADNRYYQTYDSYQPTSELISIVRAMDTGVPIARNGVWSIVQLTDDYEVQGWKIHISATLRNYQEILKIVAEICFAGNVTFKFNSDTNLFKLMNSKSTSRSSAGKFITVYPRNEGHFKELMENFYTRLKDYQGPYILTDKRYKDCKVLYYRYGEKVSMNYINYRNEYDPFIQSPDGELVPEDRRPFWNLPSWVIDVFADEENTEEPKALLNDRYQPVKGLHFSSSGGVYLAIDTHTGNEVVIKEARPYTSVLDEEKDAVYLLENEYNKLLDLKEFHRSPNVFEMFREWEHTYLVMEKIKGIDMAPFIISSNPLFNPNLSLPKIQTYNQTLQKIWTQILEGCLYFEKKGLQIPDLSINNIMIDDDQNVVFLDLESATYPGDAAIELTTVGYRSYQDNEFYFHEKIIGLFLSTIYPINGVLEIDSDKLDHILKHLLDEKIITEESYRLFESLKKREPLLEILSKLYQKDFHVLSENYLSFHEILGINVVKEEVASIRSSILKSFYNNDIRMFPADPMVYETHVNNLAYGSAGVLYSLVKAGAKEELEHYFHSIFTKPLSPERITGNLFTGSAGVAYMLAEAGESSVAIRYMDYANSHDLNHDAMDLFYGLAGIGLANLKVYHHTKNTRYREKAIEIAQLVNERKLLDENSGGYFWENKDREVYLGLGRGNAGIALFMHYIYLETNHPEYKDIRDKAILYELQNVNFTEEDIGIHRGNQRKHSEVLSPYMYDGLVGLGSILIRIDPKKYEQAIHMIHDSLMKNIYVFPSYMRGISGIGDFLLDYYNEYKKEKTLLELSRLTRLIMMFKIEKYGLHPGEQLYRMTTDLATGSAGVLLFLNRFSKVFDLEKTHSDSPFFLDSFYSKEMKQSNMQEELVNN